MKVIIVATLFLANMVMLPLANAQNAPLIMDIHSADNFTDYQYDKLVEAQELIEMIMNSAAFKSRVLNFEFKGKKQFYQNNGMSNEEIFNTLMSGAEKFPVQTAVDHMMNFDLILYSPKWYQSKNVLGYTTPDTNIIHINRSFFNDAEVNEIASNLVHEWVHKMGFDHDFRDNPNRPYSVPYAIGEIVRELGGF